MKCKIRVRQQVKEFVDALAPESQKKFKAGLRSLETRPGDSAPLCERLAGYHRLRIGGFRVLYRHLPGKVIDCVFAENRSLVYHLFERDVLNLLGEENGAGPARVAAALGAARRR